MDKVQQDLYLRVRQDCELHAVHNCTGRKGCVQITKACGIRIKNVKFEKGNKPTDWTPAPEDDERRIASLEARVAALEAAAVSGGEV